MKQSGSDTKKRTHYRLKRRLAALCGLVLFVSAAITLTGYVRFTQDVVAVNSDAPVEKADGLVVLTGDAHRIEQGIALLKSNHAKRLLISGVDEKTSRSAIAKFLGEEHAFNGCCIDIDRKAKDTIGNAIYTAEWVSKHEFRAIILVTSDYHMPRSLMLMQRAMPDIRIVPVTTGFAHESKRSLFQHLVSPVLLQEYVKYLSVRFGFEPSMRLVLSAMRQSGMV